MGKYLHGKWLQPVWTGCGVHIIITKVIELVLLWNTPVKRPRNEGRVFWANLTQAGATRPLNCQLHRSVIWFHFVRYCSVSTLKTLSTGKEGAVRFVVAAFQAAASPCARAIDCCSHAHAKILHALWSLRAPTFRLRQSKRDLPIRTRELSSCLTGQRRILGLFRCVTLKHERLTQQHVKGCIFCNTSLRPHYLSLAIVPFSLWDWLRSTSGS